VVVTDRAGSRVEHEEARSIPFGRGVLRDPFRREVVVEVGGFERAQRSFCCVESRSRSGSGTDSRFGGG
jgi:hypothetical protein